LVVLKAPTKSAPPSALPVTERSSLHRQRIVLDEAHALGAL